MPESGILAPEDLHATYDAQCGPPASAWLEIGLRWRAGGFDSVCAVRVCTVRERCDGEDVVDSAGKNDLSRMLIAAFHRSWEPAICILIQLALIATVQSCSWDFELSYISEPLQ